MEKNPRVTILIACYNDEDYIAKAINSAMHQDYEGPMTICVVNDGSTDKSWDIITSSEKSVASDTFEGSKVFIT